MRDLLRHAKPLGYLATSTAWRVADRLHLAPPRPPVAMVIERAEWAIRWYGQFIVDEVNKLQPGTAWATPDPARLTNGVVQFGSQYQWVVWNRYLSTRCRNVVSFMHGKPEDGDEAARHIEQFLKTEPKLARIVCTARLVMERLASWGVARDKMVNIPIGCETGIFLPPTLEQRRAARMLHGVPDGHVCVGSFQKDGQGWGEGDEPKPIKGPDLFLAAIDRLRRRVPVFVMLTGPARGFVKNGLAKLGVPFGHVYAKDRAELARCYHPLDIYFITSREEGGPMALMESMASGVPVVSTRVGMSPDLIVDGVTGALVEGEDMDALVARALDLLQLPDAGAALRAAAREAVKVADWSVVGRRHLDEVYRPLL
jgi:hypothetical protein